MQMLNTQKVQSENREAPPEKSNISVPSLSTERWRGPARSVSKSEYKWSPPSRREAIGTDRGATAEWMPQRVIGEQGVNLILLMPISKKASLPVSHRWVSFLMQTLSKERNPDNMPLFRGIGWLLSATSSAMPMCRSLAITSV